MRGIDFLDTPNNVVPDLSTILLNNKLARFGDSIVNFIYNAAVYHATSDLEGVKVWDKCLAQACRNTPLRKLVGSRKNAGDLGDVVEAFVAFVYLKDSTKITGMVSLLTKSITVNKHLLEVDEKELCTKAFSDLIEDLCESFGIINDV